MILKPRLRISPEGIALEVPVEFMSGVSRALMTPAATGAATEQKTFGVWDSRATKAWVAGVAMVITRS